MTVNSSLARLKYISQPGESQVTSDFDLNNDAERFDSQTLAEAAVLIPFVERAGQLHVILTKRRANLRTHPGQIAFPGGKQDKSDGGAIDAALREAEEEVGLPRRAVDVLGTLGAHKTISGFNVTPVLAHIRRPVDMMRQEQEVEEIFEVPFEFLMTQSNTRIEGRSWKGQTRYYYVIPYGPYYIWGATARMIVALRDLWHGR